MRCDLLFPILLAALSGCASRQMDASAAPVEVKLIAFNDFHGNLLPPRYAIDAVKPDGTPVRIPAGGAAYLASAIDSLKAQTPNHAVVSAGDMIGASPITSSLFLDEPTIHAMNMIGVDFNAAGNHEFDRGRAELLRMQNGGCEKLAAQDPCRIDRPFAGAKFKFLTANTKTENGGTLFSATAIKSFGTGRNAVKVGFIGLTLEGTGNLVSPSGVAGLTFADEADTANALIPTLKAQGADAIVVLIHEGAFTTVPYTDKSCGGLSGDITDILDRLDTGIDVVVSGHTHWAYICDYAKVNPAKPFLLTSAGKYGSMVTDIHLSIDPKAGRVIAKAADNIPVQSEAFQSAKGDVALQPGFPSFAPRKDVAALVERYRAAAKAEETRVIGRLAGPATEESTPAGETVLGNLIADAQLAATSAPDKGGAQIAFMNPDGIRADIVPGPDNGVTFGAIFASQPFSNTINVKTMTGQQIFDLLEQQFNDPRWTRILAASQGFRFTHDRSKPAGKRIIAASLNGVPLVMTSRYRVAMNSFLASGGDKFTAFSQGSEEVVGPLDLDTLTAWLGGPIMRPLPALDRVTSIAPAP